MAVTPTSANVLKLLPARTRCGLAFDRLSAQQKHQTYLIGDASAAFVWNAHHRAAAVVPWTVGWSNGKHQIAMSLKPSAGAWSAARCFFDRLPPTVARAAVATCFKTLVSTFGSGPWIESANVPLNLMQGGTDAIAVGQENDATFECEFAFSAPAAADSVSTSLRRAVQCVDQPSLSVACEVRLGRLHLEFSRVQTLRAGDVLIGGVPTARVALNSACNAKVEKVTRAVLFAAFSKRALATVALEQGCWRVVSLNHTYSMEPPMQDDEFLLDEGAHTENEDGLKAATPGLDLSDLKVGVDIVACRLSMTVAAIQALRAGSALELNIDLDESPIEIRVGGKLFATGTLIALDGRLAVQIATVSILPPLPVHS
jgi:type III secretion system YscQ/HrcQ family protein